MTTRKANVKHCPVCAKAGMPLEVYSSHYVRETRDPHSRVTCPMIKHNKCSNCGIRGHFASTCRVRTQPVTVAPVQKTPKQNKVTVKNRFAFESEESDENTSDDEPITEPAKMSKKERVLEDARTIDGWQKEFHMFLIDETKHENARVYWDAKHKKIIKKKYHIIDTPDGPILQYTPSWASDDESDCED